MDPQGHRRRELIELIIIIIFCCALSLLCLYFISPYPAVPFFYFVAHLFWGTSFYFALPCCALFLFLLRTFSAALHFILPYPAAPLFYFAAQLIRGKKFPTRPW